MKIKILYSILLLSCIHLAKAQTLATHLTTDLLEHTDQVFLDGYITGISLEELNTLVERYQIAEIRSKYPSLGWVVNSELPDTRQTAYQIVMASSKEKLERGDADIWNSKRVASDNSVAVRYNGIPLQPSRVYYWRVKVWDNHGNESPFSEIRSFITAAELNDRTSTYPLQITDEYPIKVNKAGEQLTFIDFGKAAFGRLKLTLASENGGDTINIRFGEHSIDGLIDREPGGSRRYTEYKLPLMAGVHTYTIKFRPDRGNTTPQRNESRVDPIFMPGYVGEVYPFRYCEIDDYSYPLTTENLVRQSVHYPFNDMAADFHSSDSILNQVWNICKYSIKATSFTGTYIDGDRERIAYEADALLNQLCHYFTDREFSMARHSAEYLIYNPTWPTEWHIQTVLMAWNDYLYTGNKDLLERCYTDLKAKTFMALKEDNGLISTKTGKLTEEIKKSVHFRGTKGIRDIVDWPQGGVIGNEKENAGEADGYVRTKYNTVVNAYHYEAVRLMSLIAGVLGKDTARKFYANEAERVKKQFNELLLDPQKGYYKDGIGTDHSSLHANMFPMAFGMVPEKNIKSVTAFIKSRRMACSVYGSQFLLDAVYNANEADYGLQLMSSTKERSWYNMIRAGSTITMEAWDNKYKPNQDWNHAWGAAPANLIPRRLMGIEPIEPGYHKIRIKPQPGTLRQASIKVPTIRGEIAVSFENDPGNRFEIDVEIPANSTAEVWLPHLSSNYKLLINNVSQKGTREGYFVKVFVGSGKHSLVIEK